MNFLRAHLWPSSIYQWVVVGLLGIGLGAAALGGALLGPAEERATLARPVRAPPSVDASAGALGAMTPIAAPPPYDSGFVPWTGGTWSPRGRYYRRRYRRR